MCPSKAIDQSLHQCLRGLRTAVPYLYAQWLIEDPVTGDYRVVATETPPGSENYKVAHRTGVIGQVFRTGKSIWLADTTKHPLYDPFDERICWELAIPVFSSAGLAAALNLEGADTPPAAACMWESVVQIVESETHFHLPKTRPEAGAVPWLTTRFVSVRTNDTSRGVEACLELASAVARSGAWVIVIGDFPDRQRDGYPTLLEAKAASLGLSGCVCGLGKRMDLLATGEVPVSKHEEHLRGCQGLLQGRYDWALFVTYGEEDHKS